jgi:hypothetical protein
MTDRWRIWHHSILVHDLVDYLVLHSLTLQKDPRLTVAGPITLRFLKRSIFEGLFICDALLSLLINFHPHGFRLFLFLLLLYDLVSHRGALFGIRGVCFMMSYMLSSVTSCIVGSKPFLQCVVDRFQIQFSRPIYFSIAFSIFSSSLNFVRFAKLMAVVWLW